MKFITEDDLRDLYKIQPFTDYEIEPGTRITPGARQFLADRGINMFDDTSWKKGMVVKEKNASIVSVSVKNSGNKRLCSRLKSMEALFLATAEELLSRDVLLTQKVINLNKNFAEIKNILDGVTPLNEICCKACSGINEENFSEDLDDCFEITEFHIQLGKGKEIIVMHKLRCALRELEIDIEEFFEGSENEKIQCEEIVGKINRIINTLSQLICVTAGGEKCQRKI